MTEEYKQVAMCDLMCIKFILLFTLALARTISSVHFQGHTCLEVMSAVQDINVFIFSFAVFLGSALPLYTAMLVSACRLKSLLSKPLLRPG